MSSDLPTPTSDFHEINAVNDGLSLFAAVLILAFGVFGVITNSSIALIFYKEKSERTAFNLICVFRAVSNVIILSATFLFLFFVKVCFGFPIYPAALESWLIHLSLTLYLGNEYQIILVALNRFCSLFFPTYYTTLCGFKPTLLVLSLIYLYRIGKVIIEQIDKHSRSCFTSFSTETLSWDYDKNRDCKAEDNILEIILYTFITMTIINVVTFMKIITFYWVKNNLFDGKIMVCSLQTRNDGNSMDRESRKRMKRNIVLFFQTMIQDSLYLVDLTFTFKLSGLSTQRIWTFISGTLVWECIHSIDGFIMMLFNERLTFLKKRFQSTPSATMTQSSGRLNAVGTTTLSTVG